MDIEIERKFLVTSDAYKQQAHKYYRIIQGFLSSVPERIVRVRLKDTQGFLTIKGKSSISGISRFEWEKEITTQEAKNLLALCEEGIIDKIRYEIFYKNKIFEVDEFLEDNHGLVLAEIELQNESENFDTPNWLGKEVTGDPMYYNSNLSKNPFKKWKK